MDVVKVEVKHPKKGTPLHPWLKETSGAALLWRTLVAKMGIKEEPGRGEEWAKIDIGSVK